MGGWNLCAASAALCDLIYPPACCGCGEDPGDAADGFCAKCRPLLRPIGKERCPRCGFAYGPHVSGADACPDCKTGWSFAQAVGAYRYEGPLREAVHRWKYQGDLRAGARLRRMFGEFLAREEFLAEIDLVVPVPLHWLRRMKRRFNQAETLARAAARTAGKPLAARALRRVKPIPSQVRLSAAARAENVKGAFRVANPRLIQGRAILLVDDVLTTCSTCNECARVLRAAGARKVFVAAVAR